jgi:hypothetical protein
LYSPLIFFIFSLLRVNTIFQQFTRRSFSFNRIKIDSAPGDAEAPPGLLSIHLKFKKIRSAKTPGMTSRGLVGGMV